MKQIALSVVAIVALTLPLIAQEKTNPMRVSQDHDSIVDQLPKDSHQRAPRWFANKDGSCQIHVEMDGSIMTLAFDDHSNLQYSEVVRIRKLDGMLSLEGYLDTARRGSDGWDPADPSERIVSRGELFTSHCLTAANRDIPPDIKAKFQGLLGIN